MDKASYRNQMKHIRSSQSIEQRNGWSLRIVQNLLDSELWKQSMTIGCYASFRGEVNTWPLLESAVAAGKILALPKVVTNEHPLQFHHVTRANEEWSLEKGAFGVQEPDATCPVVPLSQLDLILVPALAISRQGARIGWGGGFYDRTLMACPNSKAIALVFECQIQADVPTTEHDQRIDGWVSEQGLRWV